MKAERFEKILIDDNRAGRDNGVHHVVTDEIDHDVFQTGGKE